MIDQWFARLAGKPELPHEARNGLRQVAALALIKLADALTDAKLVLAWLLGALGVPAPFVAALVPIREAGALLPQVFLAARLAGMVHRRWMWVWANVAQALAMGLVAIAAVALSGAAAGWVFVAALALFSVARAAGSVSIKDILGKTVGKSRRGAVSGLAGAIASAGGLAFALLLVAGVLRGQYALAGAVAFAALLYFGAALVMAGLREAASPTAQAPPRPRFLAYFRDDRNFTRFVIARGFLTATALAPPYIVLLAGQGGALLSRLGALVIASAAAAFLSSYAWGRMADRSARRVMAFAGLAGAGAMLLALAAQGLGLSGTFWALPLALFALMIAHHGVRLGRSTYLVDIAPEGARAGYAAASNTAIGLLLLAAGAFGAVLSLAGPALSLAGFALMAAIGAGLALTIREA